MVLDAVVAIRLGSLPAKIVRIVWRDEPTAVPLLLRCCIASPSQFLFPLLFDQLPVQTWPTPPLEVIIQPGAGAYSCVFLCPPALLPLPLPRVPAPLMFPRPAPRLATVPPVSASSPFEFVGVRPSLLDPPRPRAMPRNPPLPRPRPRPPVIVANLCVFTRTCVEDGVDGGTKVNGAMKTVPGNFAQCSARRGVDSGALRCCLGEASMERQSAVFG